MLKELSLATSIAVAGCASQQPRVTHYEGNVVPTVDCQRGPFQTDVIEVSISRERSVTFSAWTSAGKEIGIEIGIPPDRPISITPKDTTLDMKYGRGIASGIAFEIIGAPTLHGDLQLYTRVDCGK